MNANFTDFDLPEALTRGLDKLGFSEPTPVQAQVIPLAIAGSDLLVSAATGSGKTAAFLLPMMQRFLDSRRRARATRALILVPTRELARQIHIHFMPGRSFTRLTAGVIIGGERRDRQIAALRRNPDILVATPGGSWIHRERGAADLADLEVLVLDEADRMLDMGFADDVLRIIEVRQPGPPVAALLGHPAPSAGLPPLPTGCCATPSGCWSINPVREQPPGHRPPGHPERRHRSTSSANCCGCCQNEPAEKVLVFTNTRERASGPGQFPGRARVSAPACLHGELDQRERNRVMSLLHGGRIRILVATDVAARGLDIPGVELVINFELARSGDDYLHRTGRTGRAGEKGLAIALVGAKEWNRMESIERYLQLELEPRKPPGLKARFSGPDQRKDAPQVPAAKPAKKARSTGPRRSRSATGTARPSASGASPPRRRYLLQLGRMRVLVL